MCLLSSAFLMESAGRFATVVFTFIPCRLHVDEAGSGADARLPGVGHVIGVTLALVHGLRTPCLNAAGLVLLARRR